MSLTYIEKITIKKDGVFLRTKSANDGKPFETWKSNSLSKTYETEGQKGLDREMLKMFYQEGCQPKGNHTSLERYRYVLDHPEANRIYNIYLDRQNEAYAALSDADRDSLYRSETSGARQYRRMSEKLEQEMFEKMTELCKEYDDLIQIPEIRKNWDSICECLELYNPLVSDKKRLTMQDMKELIERVGSFKDVKAELLQDVAEVKIKREKFEKIDFLVDLYNSVAPEEDQLDFYDVKDELDSLESYDQAIQDLGEALENLNNQKNNEEFEGR